MEIKAIRKTREDRQGRYMCRKVRAFGLLSLALFMGLLFASTLSYAGLLESLTGKRPQAARDKPPYPVIDSGYWSIDLYGDPRLMHWLDDKTVIFAGGPNSSWGNNPPKAIYLWDTERNVVTKYADASGFCYYKGILRYRSGGAGKEYKEGPIGQEKTYPVVEYSVEDAKKRGEQAHRLTCGRYKLADAKLATGEHLTPLQESDGYLDLDTGGITKERGNEPVRYFKDKDSPPVELAVKKKNIQPQSIRWVDWTGTYLMTGSPMWRWVSPEGTLSPSVPYPLYELKPGGKLDHIDIPYIKDITVGGYFMPTRAGMTVLSTETKNWREPGPSGVYFLQGKQATRLAIGIPQGWDVSPNGCRLVVGLKPKFANSPIHLKVIDFCAKEIAKRTN